jgi:hypothetical protein
MCENVALWEEHGLWKNAIRFISQYVINIYSYR